MESKYNWSNTTEPNETCSYTHTTLNTPIGIFRVCWKSYKERDSYLIELNGEYVDTAYSLDESKTIVSQYILDLREELINFVK